MTNKIYSYDPLTFQYIGEAIARRDPLEIEERFLIPAYATEKIPIFEDDKITKFVNGDWILENKPEPEPEPTPEELLQEAKDSKKVQVLINRNKWMYQPVFYVVDSVEREFKATETAGLKLTAVARNPRNIIAGTINWIDIFDAPILLTIDQAEGIISTIEDQGSYSYFHQITLDTEIKNCNTTSEVKAINIDF